MGNASLEATGIFWLFWEKVEDLDRGTGGEVQKERDQQDKGKREIWNMETTGGQEQRTY